MSTEEQLKAAEEAYAQMERAVQANTSAGAWTPELAQTLTMFVLIFALLVLLLVTWLLRKNSAPAGMVMKIFGLVLILCLSSVLLVVGYSDAQLTPIIGLFGAIAGYLLGKDIKPEEQTALSARGGSERVSTEARSTEG